MAKETDKAIREGIDIATRYVPGEGQKKKRGVLYRLKKKLGKLVRRRKKKKKKPTPTTRDKALKKKIIADNSLTEEEFRGTYGY